MNTRYIQDLTLRLSHALDQNYDVLNLDAVLSVISALEGATITKEQLETTRLAKYINQLRRRTKSEALARRAKSLLKKWREMVGIQQQQISESFSNQISPMEVSSAADTVQQMTEQLAYYSQPTSLIGQDQHQEQPLHKQLTSITHIGGSVVTAAAKTNFEDIHSPIKNAANNSATDAANTNNICHKRTAAATDKSFSYVPIPIPPVPAKFIASNKNLRTDAFLRTDVAASHTIQPRTNFANLLSGINSDKTIIANNFGGNAALLPVSNSSHQRKYKQRKDAAASHRQIAGAGVVVSSNSSSAADQQSILSTSNPAVSYTAGATVSPIRTSLPLVSNMVPIIIDIQDSNSGSDYATTVGEEPQSSTPTASVVAKDAIICENANAAAVCIKKGYAVNNLHDSCLNQQQPHQATEHVYDKCGDGHQRQRQSCISEILSLSNSSMSSMFPSSSATGGIDASASTQRKIEIAGCSSNNSRTYTKPLAKSDLTFTGKFSRHNSTSNNTDVLNTATASCETLVPFSANVCNSTDNTTTSNSRTAQFDDLVTAYNCLQQDNSNSKSKVISELQQQNKEGNNNMQRFQKQQKPPMTATTVATSTTATPKCSQQILKPPTTVPNVRHCSSSGTASAPVVDSVKGPTDTKILPRKRGRKKGSKGVDALIAKEISLCSQMLMTTLGCKKVKTTKELYAEIQNRKFGVTKTSSPTLSNWLTHQKQQQLTQNTSRPNSSCSEPSLQSPRTLDNSSTNATTSIATRSILDNVNNNNTTNNNNSFHGEIDVTDSETNTSNPSRDSKTAQHQLKYTPTSFESASNSQLISRGNDNTNTIDSATLPKVAVTLASIQQQLKELLIAIPPVPTMQKIENECISDVIPCKCKIIEILPPPVAATDDSKNDHENVESGSNNTLVGAGADCSHHQKNIIENIQLDDDSLIPPTNLCQAEGEKPHIVTNTLDAARVEKPKKSIFDLDFDDEDDPLHQIRAEAAKPPEVIVNESVINDDTETKIDQPSIQKETSSPFAVINTNVNSDDKLIKLRLMAEDTAMQQQQIILPTYVVEEDPLCEAKSRYDIQTQKITEFHITALHNYYIPYVNGNWDDNAPTRATVANSNTKTVKEYQKPKTLSLNVVPQYNALSTEYIPKDLSRLHFRSSVKSEIPEEDKFFKKVMNKSRNKKKNKKKNESKPKSQCNRKIDELSNDNVEVDFSDDNRVTVKSTVDVLDQVGTLSKAMTNHEEFHKYGKYDGANKPGYMAEDVIGCNTVAIDFNTDAEEEEHTRIASETVISDINIVSSNSTAMYTASITIDFSADISGEAKMTAVAAYDSVGPNNNNNNSSRNLITTSKETPQNINVNIFEHSTSTQASVDNRQLQHLCETHSYQNQNDQNINNNSAAASANLLIMEEKSLLKSITTPTLSSYNKNVDSRRSSICSNSSLKQNQNSINLKLRRQRLERQRQQQQQYENNGGSSNLIASNLSIAATDKRKRQSSNENLETASDDYDDCTAHITKRTKTNDYAIATGTARQMSDGDSSIYYNTNNSNNNSTDEDCDEEIHNVSAGTRNSNCDDEILIATDGGGCDEEDVGDNQDDDNEEEEAEEELEDIDDEYNNYDYNDDYYNNVGDYHEVVTRNINADDSGNNHIVLTIKKTPSKTNSPSADMLTTAAAVTATSSQLISCAETSSLPITTTQLSAADILTTDAEHITDELNLTQKTKSPIVPSEDEQQQQPLSSSSSMRYSKIMKKLQRKRRATRRIFGGGSAIAAKERKEPKRKLHRELFFAHELRNIVNGGDGRSERLLNISSCSSSCTESDDEIDSVATIVTAGKREINNHKSFGSDILERHRGDVSMLEKVSALTESTYSAIEQKPMQHTLYKLDEKYQTKKEGEQEEKTINSGREEEAKVALNCDDEKIKSNSESPQLGLYNNGLLQSFNNIYVRKENDILERANVKFFADSKSIVDSDYAANDDISDAISAAAYTFVLDEAAMDVVVVEQQQQQIPNEKCDVFSNFYNSKNSKLVYSHNNNNSNDDEDDDYNSSLKKMKRNYSNNTSNHTKNNNIDSSVNSAPESMAAAAAVTLKSQQSIDERFDNEAATNNSSSRDDNNNAAANDTQNPMASAAARAITTACAEQQFVAQHEYRTGLRAVDEDVDDEDGNNCARIQTFKEWHQVLQLRSHNDELLTVLPYVVLE